MINLTDLSQAITADIPCGQDIEYTPAFIEMEKARQGEPERQIGDTVTPSTPPNWKLVKEQALTLAKVTHDLRVTTNLTIALTYSEGFRGLEQGLQLTHALLSLFWECLHPELDNDDSNPAIMRRNTLLELTSQTFLQGVNKLNLLASQRLGKFSISTLQESLSLQNSTDDEENKRYRLVEALFQDLTVDALQEALQLLENCKQQVQSVQQLFESYVASNQDAPNLTPLVTVLEQGIKILVPKLKAKTVVSLSTEEVIETSQNPTAISIPTPTTIALVRDSNLPIQNNEQVRQALEQICAYYARYELSSPVPLLLKRAQRLVGKDFLEIVQDLNPDSLNQFEHLFGNKD